MGQNREEGSEGAEKYEQRDWITIFFCNTGANDRAVLAPQSRLRWPCFQMSALGGFTKPAPGQGVFGIKLNDVMARPTQKGIPSVLRDLFVQLQRTGTSVSLLLLLLFRCI